MGTRDRRAPDALICNHLPPKLILSKGSPDLRRYENAPVIIVRTRLTRRLQATIADAMMNRRG